MDADTTVAVKREINGSLIPVSITFLAVAALGEVWTNMPAAETAFDSDEGSHIKYDLSKANYVRIIVRNGVAPAANAKLKIQHSTDDATWSDLCSVTMAATSYFTQVGAWTVIPAAAKGDVYLRVVGVDGNGTTDPRFNIISLQVKG